ncbi:hypothetical protein Asppvi_004004 [Aspergillus pseudoviridinutans]|uniref:Uncharacterized protein n=1 Tax=Aspergillus pseudoviridinutans TaxID=1517512 RepID=A0A9P3ETJ7_9EURO|nr:uncharacterized protein Asppvi_004004 [Aspergillus pseudoviridinutans]GIJ85148.1 hypothetical protein Asppvi_004004 [Aspergillus pseudoviridinutans]
MVLYIASATSQLFGCGTLKCDCEIENRTLSALGQASFNSSYINNGTMPLTWTIGLQETQDPDQRSKDLIDQSFYLDLPQNISLSDTTAFGGCALFFTDMTTLLKFKFTDPEHGTCQDIIGTDCVQDMISLAKQEASPDSSMSNNRTLDTEEFCRDLAVALYTHTPKSCPLWLGRSQESIHVDVLTGPSASRPIEDLRSCRPTTGKNYSVSMVESYRTAVPYGTPELNATLHGLTPVMTVFYPNSSSSQRDMPVDVHFTCLTVAGPNYTSTLKNSLEATGIRAVNLWSSVGLGLMSAVFLWF